MADPMEPISGSWSSAVKDRTAEKRRCASPDADAMSETIDHVRAASESGVRPNPRVQRTRVARCARPGSPLTRHPLGARSHR